MVLPTFLESLGSAGRTVLAERTTARRVGRGSILFHEGAPPTDAVVIVGGWVKLHKHSRGGRSVMLGMRGPGDVIGELSLLDGAPRSATATAMTDLDVLAMPFESFVVMVRSIPSFTNAMVDSLAARLREASDRQLEYGTADGVARVADRLVLLADAFGSTGDCERTQVIESPLSQQELADWAGIARDGVIRALGELRSSGLVETGRRRFVIHDLAALRALVVGEG